MHTSMPKHCFHLRFLHTLLPFRWINFQRGANPFGIEQAACIGCGNCLTGCNVGAKNSLNFNYLADAKAHGAHIFTKVGFL